MTLGKASIFVTFFVIASVWQVALSSGNDAKIDQNVLTVNKPISGNDAITQRHGRRYLRYKNNYKKDESSKTSGPQTISGTSLKTKTFYKVSIKRFPDSVVTWTEKKNDQSGYHYLQVDNNKDHREKYRKNGIWFKDSQWEFVPESSNGNQKPKWYRLRNRARPNEYATWSSKEFVNDDVESSEANFIILDSRYPGKRSKSDFLFKLVPEEQNPGNEREENEKKTEYYQMKLKQIPNGKVTWTWKEYGNDSHYIQVDHDSDDSHMSRYNKGSDWYVDTLFKFDLVEDEDENNEEENSSKKKKKNDDDESEDKKENNDKDKNDDNSSNDDNDNDNKQ